LATLCLLSSNATLSFVIGTLAALKKLIVYTNGAQISLETRWRVVIVPLLVDGGGGGQGEAQCVMRGIQLPVPAMANGLSWRGSLNSLGSDSTVFLEMSF
jgi:hypothetical protein